MSKIDILQFAMIAVAFLAIAFVMHVTFDLAAVTNEFAKEVTGLLDRLLGDDK